MHVRNRSVVAVSAALAVLMTPALLFAHARLLRSAPAAMSTSTTPPTALRLWFSERPELRFSSIALADSSGASIALGALSRGDSMSLVVPISTALSAGRYTVSWRTAAADGHPTSGKFTFVVGGAQPVAATSAPPTDTATAPAPRPNVIVQPGGGSGFTLGVRWAELVAVMTLIGAVVFQLFVLPRADWTSDEIAEASDRARRLAVAVLVLFAIATAARLVAESDLVTTAGPARGSAVMVTMRDTSWGHGWMFGAVGAVIAFAGLLFARAPRTAWIAAGLGAIGICIGEALTGHSAALRGRTPLAVSVDVAHFLSAGGWLGGLTCIVLCGLPTIRRLDDRRRLLAGAQLVRAYHRAAIECVVLAVLSALLAAWLRLSAVEQLWTTAYGLALLRKIIVVALVLALGLYHWRTAVIRDWTSATARRFRLSAVAELIAAAIVIALTTILVSTPLPPSP